MEGGELFQRIQDNVEGAFTERGNNKANQNNDNDKNFELKSFIFQRLLR